MSTILKYEISDEVRAELANKLGLHHQVPLVIPCNFCYSSNSLNLFIDLGDTAPQYTRQTDVDFVNWYDENYPADDYDNEGRRLATFIADLSQRSCVVYTTNGDTRGTWEISTAVNASIASIRSFNYCIQKLYDGNRVIYTLTDSSEHEITDILSNSAIADGTEIISFYLDLSNWSEYNASKSTNYTLTICK